MKKVFSLCLFALLAWSLMFSAWTKDLFNFWAVLFVASAILTSGALFFNWRDKYDVFSFKGIYLLVGIFSAFALYVIFLVGKEVSTHLFSFANSQIASVYSNQKGAPLSLIAVLLFFFIGPAEEIFWRGFVQFRLGKHFGDNKALIVGALIYAGVHIAAWNFILISAAFICGIVWGYLFKHYKSLWPGIISHAIFDVLIFVLFPIT